VTDRIDFVARAMFLIAVVAGSLVTIAWLATELQS
jgi:hypothetical protein